MIIYFGGGVFIALGIMYLPYSLLPSSVNNCANLGFYNVLKPVLFLLAILLFGFMTWALFPDFRTNEGSFGYERLKSWGYLLSVASFEVFFCVWYLGFFATTLYPNIAAELGGGQPIDVQFIFNGNVIKDNSSQIRKVLGMTGSSSESPSLKLLLATDKSYFIEIPNQCQGSIELPRDIVSLALFGSRKITK